MGKERKRVCEKKGVCSSTKIRETGRNRDRERGKGGKLKYKTV